MRSKRAIVALSMGAFALTLVVAPAPASPAGSDKVEEKAPRIKGTIKVEGRPSLDELKKKCKISQADAEKAALKAVGAKEGAKVTYSELEIEAGFLVYAIDVKVAGKPGVEEIWIDPGNGKVLQRMHDADEDEDEESAGDDEDESED